VALEAGRPLLVLPLVRQEAQRARKRQEVVPQAGLRQQEAPAVVLLARLLREAVLRASLPWVKLLSLRELVPSG